MINQYINGGSMKQIDDLSNKDEKQIIWSHPKQNKMIPLKKTIIKNPKFYLKNGMIEPIFSYLNVDVATLQDIPHLLSNKIVTTQYLKQILINNYSLKPYQAEIETYIDTVLNANPDFHRGLFAHNLTTVQIEIISEKQMKKEYFHRLSNYNSKKNKITLSTKVPIKTTLYYELCHMGTSADYRYQQTCYQRRYGQKESGFGHFMQEVGVTSVINCYFGENIHSQLDVIALLFEELLKRETFQNIVWNDNIDTLIGAFLKLGINKDLLILLFEKLDLYDIFLKNRGEVQFPKEILVEIANLFLECFYQKEAYLSHGKYSTMFKNNEAIFFYLIEQFCVDHQIPIENIPLLLTFFENKKTFFKLQYCDEEKTLWIHHFFLVEKQLQSVQLPYKINDLTVVRDHEDHSKYYLLSNEEIAFDLFRGISILSNFYDVTTSVPLEEFLAYDLNYFHRIKRIKNGNIIILNPYLYEHMNPFLEELTSQNRVFYLLVQTINMNEILSFYFTNSSPVFEKKVLEIENGMNLRLKAQIILHAHQFELESSEKQIQIQFYLQLLDLWNCYFNKHLEISQTSKNNWLDKMVPFIKPVVPINERILFREKLKQLYQKRVIVLKDCDMIHTYLGNEHIIMSDLLKIAKENVNIHHQYLPMIEFYINQMAYHYPELELRIFKNNLSRMRIHSHSELKPTDFSFVFRDWIPEIMIDPNKQNVWLILEGLIYASTNLFLETTDFILSRKISSINHDRTVLIEGGASLFTHEIMGTSSHLEHVFLIKQISFLIGDHIFREIYWYGTEKDIMDGLCRILPNYDLAYQLMETLEEYYCRSVSINSEKIKWMYQILIDYFFIKEQANLKNAQNTIGMKQFYEDVLIWKSFLKMEGTTPQIDIMKGINDYFHNKVMTALTENHSKHLPKEEQRHYRKYCLSLLEGIIPIEKKVVTKENGIMVLQIKPEDPNVIMFFKKVEILVDSLTLLLYLKSDKLYTTLVMTEDLLHFNTPLFDFKELKWMKRSDIVIQKQIPFFKYKQKFDQCFLGNIPTIPLGVGNYLDFSSVCCLCFHEGKTSIFERRMLIKENHITIICDGVILGSPYHFFYTGMIDNLNVILDQQNKIHLIDQKQKRPMDQSIDLLNGFVMEENSQIVMTVSFRDCLECSNYSKIYQNKKELIIPLDVLEAFLYQWVLSKKTSL